MATISIKEALGDGESERQYPTFIYRMKSNIQFLMGKNAIDAS